MKQKSLGGAAGGPSGLFASVEPGATGNGGDLLVETERLRITDGAQVSTSARGDGIAGALTVIANDVDLVGGSAGGPSGLFTTVISEAGAGGDLTIDTERLRVTGRRPDINEHERRRQCRRSGGQCV